MCTPVGHALAGMAAGLWAAPKPLMTRTRDFFLFSLLAQAPDLDFIPGLLVGAPDAYHHGPSHSLGFAVLAGLLGWLWGRVRGKPWRWAWAVLLVYASHLAVDALTMDTSPPRGIPLFWPLSGEYVLSPTTIFLDVWREPMGWALVWHNLLAMGLEVVVLGPMALVSWWLAGKPVKNDLL